MRCTSLIILTLILLGCGPDVPEGVTVIAEPTLPWRFPDSVKVTAVGTQPDMSKMQDIPEVGSDLQNLDELREFLKEREVIRKHTTKPVAVDPVHKTWLEKHE